jgi:phage terminase small subunit
MQASGIVLVPAYRALLTQAATLCADFWAAWQAIQADGRYTVNKRSGVMKPHPAIDDMNKTRGQLMRVLWQLGLTPRAQRNPTAEAESKEPNLEEIVAS